MKPDQDDEVDDLPPLAGVSPLETLRQRTRRSEAEAVDDRTLFAFEMFMLEIAKRRVLRRAN
jgi:hypothetical protein